MFAYLFENICLFFGQVHLTRGIRLSPDVAVNDHGVGTAFKFGFRIKKNSIFSSHNIGVT